MNLPGLVFRENCATSDEVWAHLRACDATFVPPLSGQVVLRDYSRKLADNAVTFEAWADGVLVGVVAAYLNEPTRRTAYISNVSLLPSFSGQGIATALLQQCQEKAVREGFARLELEVARTNGPALRLYERLGFTDSGRLGETMHMLKQISTDTNI